MSNFEWQTEEEDWENWGEEPTPPPPQPHKPPSTKLIAAVVVFLLTLSGLTAIQLNRRFVSERSQRFQNVLSAHQLLLTAAENADTELFSTLIERNRYPWLRDQERLVAEGLFANRGLFDLTPVPATLGGTPVISITANSILDEATIITAQPFSHPNYDTPITLEQTYVYRLQNGRWLLAEPSASFWGESAEPITGRYVTIREVPKRDEVLAQRLLADFDQAIGRFCQTPSTTCPDDFHLHVDFGTSPHLLAPPDYIAQLQENWPINIFFRIVVLPTPTLVGIPRYEAGYEALKNGYLRQLLTAAANDMTDFRCCDHLALYRALLRQQFIEAELQTNMLAAEDYTHYFRDPLSFINALTHLQETPFDPFTQQQAHLLASYLLDISGSDPLTLQQQLLKNEPLDQLLNDRDPTLLAADFATFITAQSPTNAAPSPEPFPDQTIETVCRTADTYTHYNYDPARNRWQSLDINPDAQLINLHILADDTGRLWDVRGGRGSTQQLTVQYDDQPPIDIYETDNLSLGRLTVRWTHPNREKLTLVNVAPMRPSPSYATFDSTTCPTGNCEVISSTGLPLWSPSGNQTLLLQEGELLLTDASGRVQQSFGRATWPFLWLDDYTIAYAQLDPSNYPPSPLVSLDLATNSPAAPFLSWGDLPTSPTAQGDWQITVAMPVPQKPDWLLLQRHYFYGNEAQTFLHNWQTGETHILPVTNPFGYPLFSADGRWLIWQSRGLAPSYLISTADGSAVTAYPAPTFINNNNTHFFDWSADGRWLLHLDEGFMRLTLPEQDYTKIIPYPAGTHLCTSGGWLHTMPPSPQSIIIEKPTLPENEYLR